jgi:hypothetical protein
MQRDLSLLRRILLDVEAAPVLPLETLPAPEAPDQAAIAYHVDLAIQAGFLSAEDLESVQGKDGVERRIWRHVDLTWRGAETLDLIRDEEAFLSAAEHVRERLGGVPFATLLTYLRRRAGLG